MSGVVEDVRRVQLQANYVWTNSRNYDEVYSGFHRVRVDREKYLRIGQAKSLGEELVRIEATRPTPSLMQLNSDCGILALK